MKKWVTILMFVGLWSGLAVSDQTPPANQAKVEITSWIPIGNSVSSRLGEVCGKVTGYQTPTIALRIKPDYNTKTPGNYNTFAGTDGKFCQVVMTYAGTVEVSVLDGNSTGTFVDQARF